MSQVISCPNCDKKLARKDDLRGRALICPQCQNRFTPSTEESPSPGGFGMDFLDNLGPAPGPVAAKTATKTSSAARGAAKGAASVTSSAASRTVATRAKEKKDQMMLIYIGGGIAAAVLVVIVAFMVMSSGGHGGGKGQKSRFGMTLSQRQKFFEALFHAVDEIGSKNQYKDCRDEWRRLGREKNLTDQQIADILKEGMDQRWEQPALAATMDQKQKTNRIEWVRTMNETSREPVMSQ